MARVMRDGLESGVTIPRVLVERALAQVEAIAPPAEKVADSALWKPMTAFPSTIDGAARGDLEAEYRRLLVDQVFPAMHRLASFVRKDYLPRARTTDGIASVPGGDRMYRYVVRNETTTDLTPEQIHELGFKEVARITPRLLEAGRAAGFEGSMADLQKWIRSNPANYPFKTPEDVIAYLYEIHKRIVPHLPRLFGRHAEGAVRDPAARARTGGFAARAMAAAVGRRHTAGHVHDAGGGREEAAPRSDSRRCSRMKACRDITSTAASSSKTRCRISGAGCG